MYKFCWSSDKLSVNNLAFLKFGLSALGRDDLNRLVQEYENKDFIRKFATSYNTMYIYTYAVSTLSDCVSCVCMCVYVCLRQYALVSLYT